MSQYFQMTNRGNVATVRFLGPKIMTEDRDSLYGLVETHGTRNLVLDFRDVKLLTSAPIGILLNLKQKAEAGGGKIALCQLDADIREILKLTSVENLFSIFDSEDDAIKFLEAS